MSNLSQAEIDNLINKASKDKKTAQHADETELPSYTDGEETGSSSEAGTGYIGAEMDENKGGDVAEYFTPEEIDALGEIGNICMGTSATTMNMLLGRKVVITTPQVAMCKTEDVFSAYKCPFLAISVEFVEGLYGKNLLILKDYDAALITDLLMGGEGSVDQNNIVLTEIHLSAVSEVMNQMIGSAATAMSNMMGDGVNISPPKVSRMTADENIGKYLDEATPLLTISFDMEIEGLLKSNLLQIMSIDMAKDLITSLMHQDEPQEEVKPPEKARVINIPAAAPSETHKRPSTKSGRPADIQHVKSVKPADYEVFQEITPVPPAQDVGVTNFDLINDIPLHVTVELGKTKKNLNDILNFGIGSIIVLDKQAGELVDVIVNGKRIAKGEVVVIDENYGVRITELIKT